MLFVLYLRKRMGKLFTRILFVFAVLLAAPDISLAQTAPPPGQNNPQKAPPSSRIQRKIARKKWREQRKKERAEKKKIKDHHKRIQTKDTRKRMKKDRGIAADNNSNKPEKEFFLKRWFKRDPNKKKKKRKENPD